MGPLVDTDWRQLVLRPFPTSTTCANLMRDRQGVFHVTDDCELLARAAVGRIEATPPLVAVEGFTVARLADTCRWYAFAVDLIETREPRVRLECSVVRHATVRDFLGFNRAKHAVLEAAILATRVQLVTADFLRGEMARLRVIVDKTAGDQERRGFAVLDDFLREKLG